jgi:hypothetical protein
MKIRKVLWLSALALSFTASPARSATGPAKIWITYEDDRSADLTAKLDTTVEIIHLLAPKAHRSSSRISDGRKTVCYEAPSWSTAIAPSVLKAGTGKLLELWGSDIVMENAPGAPLNLPHRAESQSPKVSILKHPAKTLDRDFFEGSAPRDVPAVSLFVADKTVGKQRQKRPQAKSRSRRQKPTPTVTDALEASRNISAYRPLIRSVAASTRVDPLLLEAMVMQENPWGNPSARSHKGAVGLGQLMPKTARLLKVKDRTDPAQNLRGMALHLRSMLAMFKGNVVLAVAAYNAGEVPVLRAHRRVPPLKETMLYVSREIGRAHV